MRKIIRKKSFYLQYAALPFRVVDGQLQVLLLTSRETKRWVLPKGWPEKRMKPYDVAAKEAFEEAGIRGDIAKTPIAAFEYLKQLDPERRLKCLVDVFPMKVREELQDWPERAERTRSWMVPAEAAKLVAEKGLRLLLLDVAKHPDQADFTV